MTDEARFYKDVGKEFASHEAVNHGEKEYVRYWNEVTNETRADGKPRVETTTITTSTVEGCYSGRLSALFGEASTPRSLSSGGAAPVNGRAFARPVGADPLARNDEAGSLTSTASAARAA
jgi:hypothetical protein